MLTVFWILSTLYNFVLWVWTRLWVVGQELVNGAASGIWDTWHRAEHGDAYSLGLSQWGIGALSRLWLTWLQPFLVDVFHLLITVNTWFIRVAGAALQAGRALRDRVLRVLLQHLLDLYLLFVGWREVLGLLKDRLGTAASRVDQLLFGDRVVEYQAFEQVRTHLNEDREWINYTWHYDGLLRMTPFLASVAEWGSWVFASILVGFHLPDLSGEMEDIRRAYPELTPRQVAARLATRNPDLEAAAMEGVQTALQNL